MNNYDKSYGEVKDFEIEEEDKFDTIIEITYVVLSLIYWSFCMYACMYAII
jgi:hypothetical protein